jgi:hypothetical protein
MRGAQLRLRQTITMTAVALLVAVAALTAVPRQHALNLVVRVAAQQAPTQPLQSGRRWY